MNRAGYITRERMKGKFQVPVVPVGVPPGWGRELFSIWLKEVEVVKPVNIYRQTDVFSRGREISRQQRVGL